MMGKSKIKNQKSKIKKGSFLNPFKAIRFLWKKPKTLKYPFELKEPALRYRGLHLNDWDKCTGCGNCADICPNEAIEMVEVPELKPKPEEGIKNERPKIDYGRCCFCGLCVDICPPGSLRLSRDYLHIHFKTDTFNLLAKDEKTDKEHFLHSKDYSVLKASLEHRRRDYEGFTAIIYRAGNRLF
jgi:glutamate synthase (NADPH/NADH) small chain